MYYLVRNPLGGDRVEVQTTPPTLGQELALATGDPSASLLADKMNADADKARLKRMADLERHGG